MKDKLPQTKDSATGRNDSSMDFQREERQESRRSTRSIEIRNGDIKKALKYLPNVPIDKACFSGSYALSKFQSNWINIVPTTNTNDIDYFVCGNDYEFTQLLDTFLSQLDAANINYQIQKKTRENDSYFEQANINCIVDVFFPNCIWNISLIHHGEENTRDVVNGFDLDICRVRMKFARGLKPVFYVDDDIEFNIRQGCMVATYRTPARFYVSLRRIKKYERRGFILREIKVCGPTSQVRRVSI